MYYWLTFLFIHPYLKCLFNYLNDPSKDIDPSEKQNMDLLCFLNDFHDQNMSLFPYKVSFPAVSHLSAYAILASPYYDQISINISLKQIL